MIFLVQTRQSFGWPMTSLTCPAIDWSFVSMSWHQLFVNIEARKMSSSEWSDWQFLEELSYDVTHIHGKYQSQSLYY